MVTDIAFKLKVIGKQENKREFYKQKVQEKTLLA